MQVQVPAIFTAIDRFTAPVRQMSAATSSFASVAEVQAARAGRAFTMMATPITRATKMLGGFGLMIGGFALIGAVGGAISIFKDFEQANANLASVMRDATSEQLTRLSADARRLGSITARTSTEVVGLQESFARLGFGTDAIINMTEATISGSIAMVGGLSDTAEMVGAVINSFNDFDSIDTPMIIDQLTRSTQLSALNFEKLQTMIPIVGKAADSVGVPFTELIAMLGKAADSSIDASTAATAIRNIFIKSAAAGSDYKTELLKIANSSDKLTTANDLFGERAAVTAVVLADNMDKLAAFDKELRGAAGTADEAAKKQLNTLTGALTILGSAYEGFILSTEDGNGALRNSLVFITQSASEMLTLASGVERTAEEYEKVSTPVRVFGKLLFIAAHILGIYLVGLLLLKAYSIGATMWSWALTTATKAKNLALGISNTLTWAAGLSTAAWATSTITATGAQWGLNAAMAANPIVAVVAIIIALIALIVSAIYYYEEWGAAILFLIGPIGWLINAIQSLRRNWDMVKEAFSTGGIIAGLKAIGLVLLDAILMPLQQILEIASNLPDFLGGGVFGAGAEGLQNFRTGLGVSTAPVEAINPEANRQDAFKETVQTNNNNQNVTFDFKNVPAGMEILNGDMMPQLTSTM